MVTMMKKAVVVVVVVVVILCAVVAAEHGEEDHQVPLNAWQDAKERFAATPNTAQLWVGVSKVNGWYSSQESECCYSSLTLYIFEMLFFSMRVELVVEDH